MYKIICFLFLGILVVGCNKTPDNIQDMKVTDTGVTITTDDGKVRVSTGDLAKLPKNFPTDIYIYENSKLLSSAEVPGGYAMNFETNDSLEAVSSKYKTEMASKGWNLKNSMSIGAQKMYIFGKENKISTLALEKSDNATTIAITSIKQ